MGTMAQSEKQLPRPYEYLDGDVRRVKTVLLPVCKCEDRRGPSGGVCGNCNGAIPEKPTSAL